MVLDCIGGCLQIVGFLSSCLVPESSAVSNSRWCPAFVLMTGDHHYCRLWSFSTCVGPCAHADFCAIFCYLLSIFWDVVVIFCWLFICLPEWKFRELLLFSIWIEWLWLLFRWCLRVDDVQRICSYWQFVTVSLNWSRFEVLIVFCGN